MRLSAIQEIPFDGAGGPLRNLRVRGLVGASALMTGQLPVLGHNRGSTGRGTSSNWATVTWGIALCAVRPPNGVIQYAFRDSARAPRFAPSSVRR